MSTELTIDYIKTLAKYLPDSIKAKSIELDLILGGGAFNGSYMNGALMFIKEMERNGWLHINRISCVSVGGMCGYLYMMDALEVFDECYAVLVEHFRTNYNLNKVAYAKERLREVYVAKLAAGGNKVCSELLTSGRMHIAYWDVVEYRKIVENRWDDIDAFLTSLVRSMFVPILVDGCLCMDEKYMDGVTPHMLYGDSASMLSSPLPQKTSTSKTLYIDLLGYDKLYDVWNISNEMTNTQRVMSGVLDVHGFFVKGRGTAMCSYVEDWWFPPNMQLYKDTICQTGCVFVIWLLLRMLRIWNQSSMCKRFIATTEDVAWIRSKVECVKEFGCTVSDAFIRLIIGVVCL